MTPLLQARDITCERGGLTLFAGLSLGVNAGEILHVVGPNGSGKTTLLRLLAGLSVAAQGELLWNGRALASQRDDFLAALLYLGHKSAIKSTLTPRENLRWYFPLRSNADIVEALARWQLQGYEDQPCYQLSQGQQQRVALCRLLLSKAALWLLDEPFNAIDRHGVEQLETVLVQHAERGGAVILTTHHEFKSRAALRVLSLEGSAAPEQAA